MVAYIIYIFTLCMARRPTRSSRRGTSQHDSRLLRQSPRGAHKQPCDSIRSFKEVVDFNGLSNEAAAAQTYSSHVRFLLDADGPTDLPRLSLQELEKLCSQLQSDRLDRSHDIHLGF